MRRTSGDGRLMVCLALLNMLALGGCYEGVQIPAAFEPPENEGVGAGEETTGPEVPEDPPNGDGDGEEEAALPPPSLRLLSAHEYENSVRDLLQVDFESDIYWGDAHTGFDNGALAQLDQSLVSLLVLEAETVAGRYVEERLLLEYPCFSEAPPSSACVADFVDSFGLRAYRRPLTESDRGTLVDFAAALQVEGPDGPELAQWMVTRMLVSPKFLYRVEGGRLDGADPASVDVFDRASIISYAMTGSMPDSLLLADALNGALDEEATAAAHIRRLAQTPRGQEQLLRFAKQWLRVSGLDRMRDQPEEFSKLPSAEMGRSLADEFDLFVETTLLNSGTLKDLLLGTTYHVDEETAPLYGLQAPAGPEMTPVQAPEGRVGVFGLASVLATHASSALVHRDKPIARGMMIKNQFLCEEIGLPSGIDIDSAAEDAGVIEEFDQMTSREQLETIMNQGEICVTCHQTFMTYGFLFANYDALGQYQTHFGDRVLDAHVDNLLLDGELGNYTGSAAFVPALAQSDQVAACYAEQVARFIAGSNDGVLTERLAEDFEGFDADDIMLDLFEKMLLHPSVYERETTP